MSTNPPNPLTPFPPPSAYPPPSQYPIATLRTQDFPGKVRVAGYLFAIMGSLALLIFLGAALAIPFYVPAAMNTTESVSATDADAQPGSANSTDVSSSSRAAMERPKRTGSIAALELVILVLGGLGAGLPLTAAYGLLKRRSWGRTLALVDAFIIVLSFPLGTALGSYTMWLFLQSGARQAYAQLAASEQKFL